MYSQFDQYKDLANLHNENVSSWNAFYKGMPLYLKIPFMFIQSIPFLVLIGLIIWGLFIK